MMTDRLSSAMNYCLSLVSRQASLRHALLGPFHGAIAVPSVTRCRCCCGHRFYIAIHQVSLLLHAACAIVIAGFGSSSLGSGVDSSDTW